MGDFGSMKDAPDAPDPVDTAFFQNKANLGTTKLNVGLGNTGTVTPYGTTSWEKTGTTKIKDPYTGKKYKMPTFNEVVTLSDSEQKKFDLSQATQTNFLNLANQLSGQLGQHMATPFKLGDFDFGADLGVDAYQPGQSLDSEVYRGDPLKLGNEATEARLFDLGSKRLDPKFAQDRASLQSSLLSRGIREGTAAWDAAMRNFNEGENDAYNQLLLTGRGQAAAETQAEWQAGLTGQGQTFNQLLQSRGLGMAEQGQQFGQTMADRQRLLQERGQETGEAFALRSQPINEIAALLGTGQVNIPQLTGHQQPQMPITDVAGLINTNWDQQFQAWQAESQAQQSMLGGLFGMAGNIFASDERIKEKGDVVGTTAEGLPIYEFKVGDGETQTGVMAQDVEKQNPEAVIDTPAGIKAVDYGAAVGAGDGTYTVEKGDNLWDIGQRFGVGVPDIVAANQIPDPDRIMPGDKLVIPGLAAPGPEAIPYDPRSSAFLPPADGSGLPAVVEALQPANDVDMMTQVDDGGAYLLPPNVGGARPEGPALGFGPQFGASAEMGPGAPPDLTPASGPIMADPLMGIDRELADSVDRMRSERESLNLANDIGFTRRQMEPMTPPFRQQPSAPPPPAAPPMESETGLYGDPSQYPPDAFTQPQPQAQMAPPPPVGTVEAGSTGGEFFSPPPPMADAVDPLAGRFGDAFDTPAGRAEIMDLLAAFQNRQMLNPMMGGIMRAGIGGF